MTLNIVWAKGSSFFNLMSNTLIPDVFRRMHFNVCQNGDLTNHFF